jgi:hypothetical protein
MFKRALVVTAAVCAAASLTIGTIASASGDEGRKVNFVVHSPIVPSEYVSAFPANLSRCTLTATGNVASPCVAPVTPTEPTPGAYNDTVTGDLTGTGQFAASAILTTLINILPGTSDIPYTNYEPYSPLTVKECGMGTVIVRTTGNVGVVAGSTTGRWQVVPNSGRGGLVGISGSGTFTVSHNPDGTTSNISVGHVRCGGKHE